MKSLNMRRLGGTTAWSLILSATPVAGASDDFRVGDRIIETSVVVDAGASEVFRAWTTSDGLESFFAKKALVDLKPGGEYELHFLPEAPEGSRGSEGCTILSYLPNRMLSFSWNAPPLFPEVRDSGIHTIVVLHIEPLGRDRSRVVLRHHGWPDQSSTTEQWDEVYAYFQNAWPKVMTWLRDRHADEASQNVDPANGWVYLFVGFNRPDLLETMTEDEKEVMQQHFLHLKALTEQGQVILAGPCTDMKGPGIVIFHADDESEARAMMESDPAVKHGLFVAELHPMRLSLLRERDS